MAKTYQYCVAENWGKGFIDHDESFRITFKGYPANVWQVPAGLDVNPFTTLSVELYHICPLTGDGGSDVTDTKCVPRISLYVAIINPYLLI